MYMYVCMPAFVCCTNQIWATINANSVVIKECNHGTNAMPFRLFIEQRQQNIFCQGLFGIDWCFCFSG